MSEERIYLVHGESGEWSDHSDWIIGAFNNKRGAEELRDKRIKEAKEYEDKCEIARRLNWDEITEEQAGMTKKEAQDYWYSEPESFYITSLALNTEDVEKNGD
ncbi:MAG: hypothetical protein KA953_00630 [Lachnospiraceae bacterium]|nr:hypothetical protein [Lachnospiraceae bacterium]